VLTLTSYTPLYASTLNSDISFKMGNINFNERILFQNLF